MMNYEWKLFEDKSSALKVENAIWGQAIVFQ
jgi:hypothetical protein